MRKAISLVFLFVATSASADPDKGGFWCFIHQDGSLGLCGRESAQCEVALNAYNDTARSLGEAPITNECKWQASAWELVTKRKIGPGHHFPVKKLCTQAMEKGDSCRLAR